MRPNVVAISLSIVVAVLAIGFAPPSRADETTKPAESRKDKTVWASRTLHIPLAPDVETFQRMFRAAARQNAKVLGVDESRAELHVQAVPESREDFAVGGEPAPSVNRVTVIAKLYNDSTIDPHADEFIDGVVESLRKQIHSWLTESGGVVDAEREMQDTANRVDKTRNELRRLEDQVREATGRIDATTEQVRAAAPKLEEERQALKLAVVGKQARLDAITQTIARLSKAAEQRAKDDAVAVELEKVVNAREVAYQRIKDLYGAGQAGMSELVQAEVPIAEARAKLLERRDAVAQNSGGELLSVLNRELAMVSIDVAEARAKLAALEEQLQRFDGVRDELDGAEQLRLTQTRLLRSLEDAERAFREASKAVPKQPLRVIKSDSMAPGDPRLSKQPPAAPGTSRP